jgi:hypothetical protein
MLWFDGPPRTGNYILAGWRDLMPAEGDGFDFHTY